MGALADYLAVTLFIALCGITFHLPGYIATERESGISSLVDVMSQNSGPSTTAIARSISSYVAFAVIYSPGWAAVGIIVSRLIFSATSPAIVISFHLLLGLALTSYTLFLGSFFKRAQLSGITVLILSLLAAIVSQFVPRTPIATGVLGALFPPAAYTEFAIQLAQWERELLGASLIRTLADSSMDFPIFVFFAFLGGQAIVYLILAIFVQRFMHGTARKKQRQSLAAKDEALGLKLVDVSKTFGRSKRAGRNEDIRAVDHLSLSIGSGQLVSLLGVNGSGKSTLLAGLTGTQPFSSGHVELDPRQTIGLCPQANVAWDDLTGECGVPKSLALNVEPC